MKKMVPLSKQSKKERRKYYGVKARVVERGFARDARCAKPQNI